MVVLSMQVGAVWESKVSGYYSWTYFMKNTNITVLVQEARFVRLPWIFTLLLSIQKWVPFSCCTYTQYKSDPHLFCLIVFRGLSIKDSTLLSPNTTSNANTPTTILPPSIFDAQITTTTCPPSTPKEQDDLELDPFTFTPTPPSLYKCSKTHTKRKFVEFFEKKNKIHEMWYNN